MSVVLEQPPEPFPTLYGTYTCCRLADCGKEQEVVLTLMISLVMKMLHILCQRMAE